MKRRRRRTESAVDHWLDNAGRQPLLSAAAELHLGALVREWQDHPDGPDEAPPAVRRRGLKARERLIACNLRLVALVCDRYPLPPQLAMEDALQGGTIGLCRAAELFDPARGYKFSTYAFLWIRQAVTREVDNSGTIRIPANVGAAMRGTRYGKPSPKQLAAAELVWRGCISLDASAPSATDEDARTLGEVIVGGRLDVADLGQAESVSQAWEAMEQADPEGVALLQLHHGDGARVGELATLTDSTRPGTSKRLKAASETLRVLPEVQVALAG